MGEGNGRKGKKCSHKIILALKIILTKYVSARKSCLGRGQGGGGGRVRVRIRDQKRDKFRF